MDAAVARREGETLLGVLDGDGFLEAVLQRDLHPDRDRRDVVVDVSKITFGVHRNGLSPARGRSLSMGTVVRRSFGGRHLRRTRRRVDTAKKKAPASPTNRCRDLRCFAALGPTGVSNCPAVGTTART